MDEFFGKTYLYPTPNHGLQTIGVCRVLGKMWAVCWLKPGARVRVKTSLLPVGEEPDYVQGHLDVWAKTRGLREVAA